MNLFYRATLMIFSLPLTVLTSACTSYSTHIHIHVDHVAMIEGDAVSNASWMKGIVRVITGTACTAIGFTPSTVSRVHWGMQLASGCYDQCRKKQYFPHIYVPKIPNFGIIETPPCKKHRFVRKSRNQLSIKNRGF